MARHRASTARMMFPNPDDVPRLPVARSVLRESRFVDVELHPEAVDEYGRLGIQQGDLVELSQAPIEPDGVPFVVDQSARSRGGLVVTVRPVGPSLEEGRVCVKGLLTGSKYTIVSGGRVGEFTVHRNMSVEGVGALKLHFAHGSQLQKLQMVRGCSIKIKEKPCGMEDWTVLEVHTENLERCPNCRTGLSGPRAKEFNAEDLCAAGTQWALVHPKNVPPQGVALFAERTTATPPAEMSQPPFLRFVARPDPRR